MTQLHKHLFRWQQIIQIFSLEQEFEITETFDVDDYSYIAARQVQIGLPFNITATTRLGGIPLEPYLEQPRSVDEQGRNRMDIFIFCCSVLDSKPVKGSVVLLTNI